MPVKPIAQVALASENVDYAQVLVCGGRNTAGLTPSPNPGGQIAPLKATTGTQNNPTSLPFLILTPISPGQAAHGGGFAVNWLIPDTLIP